MGPIVRLVGQRSLAAGLAGLWVIFGLGAGLWGAQSPGDSMASSPRGYGLETEVDISGPYHAWVANEDLPATVDIWGPKATVKISVDGQEKPMRGLFINNQLKVVAKYGPANFNLTTMIEAIYDGWNFHGRYSRLDDRLGLKVAPILLTPAWPGGGGWGEPVKMPLPRRAEDVPGRYGLVLTQGERSISTDAEFEVDQGTIRIKAGGREYLCDYSDQQIFPLYWQGNRMDTFRLKATETGFEGTLTKEVAGQTEEFEVLFVKRRGGGNGHDRDWTYVYDAIINNVPPVWIAKLTLHDDQARLVIDINDQKATMTGSLDDSILSGTGKYGAETVSIRARKVPLGFAGLFRKGSGARVVEVPIVLRNRRVRAVGIQW
ncbi:MAG TPA: hypothetical protein EYP56_05490 [Planctomycetaceae bacterium]|nr:hypothetical protein [Planctomycetaceae bacterium]HIQ20853.1 hypothetical protein [Planctomycetota bacterium]